MTSNTKPLVVGSLNFSGISAAVAGFDSATWPQRLPELRDLALHLGDGRDRGCTGVELVREPLDGNHPVRPEQQDRESRTLLRPAELYLPPVADDLQWPEDAECEHAPDGSRSVAKR